MSSLLGLQLAISPLTILVLQLLAVACLVAGLVLVSATSSSAHQDNRAGTEPSPNATTETVTFEEDDPSGSGLDYTWHDNPAAHQPSTLDHDPCVRLHFSAALPSRADSDRLGSPHVRPGEENDCLDTWKGQNTYWLRSVVATAVILVLLSAVAIGINQGFGVGDDNYYDVLGWPLEFSTQPLELWDDAWGVLGKWADCMEPLMPAAPQSKDSIYDTFDKLPNYRWTLSKLSDNLNSVSEEGYSLFESWDSGPHEYESTGELLTFLCHYAVRNLEAFDSGLGKLVSYFSVTWMSIAKHTLWGVGFNISVDMRRGAYGDLSTDESGSAHAAQTGVNSAGANLNFNNHTAIRLLTGANPSFPELEDLAANLTSELRNLQSKARDGALLTQAVLNLVPTEARSDPGQELQLKKSFLQQWEALGINSWLEGESYYSEHYSPESMQRSANEALRVVDVLQAFEPHISESIRRTEALQRSLHTIARSVAALNDTRSKKGAAGSFYGAWVTPGWRADCRCSSDTDLPPPSRVGATPVAVAHFVPSAGTILRGAAETYQMIVVKGELLQERVQHSFAESWARIQERKEREEKRFNEMRARLFPGHRK